MRGAGGSMPGEVDGIETHVDETEDGSVFQSDDDTERQLQDSALGASAHVEPEQRTGADQASHHRHHQGCPAQEVEGSIVHHFHHQHCPGVPCAPAETGLGSRSVASESTEEIRRTVRHIEIDIQFLQNHRFRVQQEVSDLSSSLGAALQEVDRTFSSIHSTFGQLSPGCFRRSSPPPRRRRQRSPSPPRRRRPSPGWEPIRVLSPVRSRGSARRSPATNRRTPRTSSPNPQPTPSSPCQARAEPHPRPRAANSCQRVEAEAALTALATVDPVPPTASPSRLRARLANDFGHFSPGTRRNTRRFFFFELLRIRERFPEASVDAGWSRLVARLRSSGFYATEDDVNRAWMIAFEEPPQAHFRRLYQTELEVLRSHLPASFRTLPENLIRF